LDRVLDLGFLGFLDFVVCVEEVVEEGAGEDPVFSGRCRRESKPELFVG
jgi:hypothetical protein